MTAGEVLRTHEQEAVRCQKALAHLVQQLQQHEACDHAVAKLEMVSHYSAKAYLSASTKYDWSVLLSSQCLQLPVRFVLKGDLMPQRPDLVYRQPG